MMHRSRVVERLSGQGQILSGQRRVADVSYSLEVHQDFIHLETERGSFELPGSQDIRGRADLLSGSRDLLFGNEGLWLYLEDGSRLEVLCVPEGEGRTCDLIGRGLLIRSDSQEAAVI